MKGASRNWVCKQGRAKQRLKLEKDCKPTVTDTRIMPPIASQNDWIAGRGLPGATLAKKLPAPHADEEYRPHGYFGDVA